MKEKLTKNIEKKYDSTFKDKKTEKYKHKQQENSKIFQVFPKTFFNSVRKCTLCSIYLSI